MSDSESKTSVTYGFTGLHVFLFLFFVFLVGRWRKGPREGPVLRSVAILVLGDVGRSPRMMYHAQSFAKNGYKTYLVGYKGSKLIRSLRETPNFRTIYLSKLTEPPPLLAKSPFVVTAPIKIIHQVAAVLTALLIRIEHPPEFILVQNPPSIPTLALVWFTGRILGSKVIIDWHNLGYSILALKLGKKHPFVRIAERFEAYFGRTAYAHLFVTQAMRDHLVREWDLKGLKAVLHDRPPAHFHRCTPEEFHELFVRLWPSITIPELASFLPSYSVPYSTPFTTVTPSTTTHSTAQPPPSDPFSRLEMPTFRDDRPALLVSSTSWTPDEDFSILLEALALYEERATKPDARLPKLMVVVTGKGPLKDTYMSAVRELQKKWKWVRCISLWLEAEDYPLLLGTADLGVCLHSSSSALDLPMKIVDMFGCGLPVCALDFACLDELVKDGVNGLIFKDAEQLAGQFASLLRDFPSAPALTVLRDSLVSSSRASDEHLMTRGDEGDGEGVAWAWNSWEDNWNKVMKPLVSRDADGRHAEWS